MADQLLLRPETTEDALPAAPVASAPAPTPAPVKNEAPAVFGNEPMVQTPTRKQQSWGAIISIVIIVLMVVIGAFYAWGKRIAETRSYPALQAQ